MFIEIMERGWGWGWEGKETNRIEMNGKIKAEQEVCGFPKERIENL